MLGKTYNRFSNRNRLFAPLAAIIILFLLAGCATGGNYGKVVRDRDLDNMFLKYEVLPDHRYYTSGSYDRPDAILAIHKDYELDNTKSFWVTIPNVDYAQMRKWIDTIAPDQNYKAGYFAAYILNPDGKRVGAWYSSEAHATVKFLEGNKILVYAPTPDLDLGRPRRGRGR